MDLEKSGPKRHTHFKKGEQLPLTIGDTLGKGGYGAVYKAHSTLSGRTYALKIFRRTRKNAREVQSFMVELQVLQRINHHHCVELAASYTDSRNFGLLMSPVADYNLSAFYEGVMKSNETQKALCNFFGRLANALRFLHDSKIRHRDIKPENILVKGPEVYLTDFGISLDWENLTRSTTTADSAKSWTYCAPEVANYQKRNSSSDVWSLGCVFLEMRTVLQGATVQDLRKLMNAHSERPRYYENLDVVLGWVARLNAHHLDSEGEVMGWIRIMLVIEPSARATAEALSLSILKFGKRGKSKAIENRFCGDCCAQEHEEESEPESVSEDDGWGGDFGDDITTPATSLPATDPAMRPRVPSSAAHAPRQAILSVPTVSASFDNLALSEAGSNKDVLDLEVDDVRLPETSKSSTSVPAESDHVRTTSLGGSADRTAQDEADTSPAALPPLPGDATATVIDPNTDKAMLTTVGTAAPIIEDKPSLEHRLSVRQQAIEVATSNNPTWPFTDLQGRLPALAVDDWEKPSVFLNAIRSDVAFMQYLKLIDAPQFERLEAATPGRLFPVMHLLLLNGLDVNNDRFKRAISPGKGIMPLYRTLGTQWHAVSKRKGISRLLIGFGARVDSTSDTSDSTPLAQACTQNDVELIKIMADVDASMLNT
jgi:serine/threonine protein kinase